jgi:hypothetical protein
VHACRYAGLLEASVAAYHRAIRLDPAIRTSVAHTFFMIGDYSRVIECDVDNPPYMTVLAHYALGHRSEALEMCNTVGAGSVANEHLLLVIDGLKALLERRIGAGRSALAGLQSFTMFSDPEGLYLWAQISAELGDTESTFSLLDRAVDTGFYATQGLEVSPLFESVRSDSRYEAIIERARAGQHAARRAFDDAGGQRLLGLGSDAE